MIDSLPALGSTKRRISTAPLADLSHLFAGRLDLRSFISGLTKQSNPTQIVVKDGDSLRKLGYNRALEAAGFREGIDNPNDEPFREIINDPYWDKAIRSIHRSHNLRVTMGRDDIQRGAMWGDITANSSGFAGRTGTASSAPSATTLTNSGASFPTSGGVGVGGLQGHIVYCPVAGVYGVIVSNSATVLTVDQWYDMTSAVGAAGTTPSNGAAYAISPGMGLSQWIGLSTNSGAPSSGDVLRTADGLFADGTTSAGATEQNTNGLSRAFIQPTSISGGIQLQYTWTYSGSSTVTIAKGVLCNSLATAGSLLMLETLLSSSATVNASGDTLQLTWQATL